MHNHDRQFHLRNQVNLRQSTLIASLNLRSLLAGLLLVGLMLAGNDGLFGRAAAETPDDLRAWEPWLLENHPQRDCPFLFSDASQRVCAWPSRLQLKIDDQGVSFRQSWQVYAENWIPLPGNRDHWPQFNSADSKNLIRDQQGRPVTQLQPGKHMLIGRISWLRTPEFIPLPAATGLLSVTIDNKLMHNPVLDDKGRLWLGTSRDQPGAGEPGTNEQADRVSLRLFRKLHDGVPFRVTTRLELEVAGKDREWRPPAFHHLCV